jgi:integrase
MARAIHKLTPERVRNKSKVPGLYADGGGLYLRVTPPAACSWVYRYMIDGKAREMGLGSFPEVPLQRDPKDKKAAPGARELAAYWRKVRAQGKDPIAVREAERAAEQLEAARAMTFRQCAEAYIAAHRDSWKNPKHAKQWDATLEAYAYPVLGDLPASSVDVTLVTQVLDPIWKTKTETASRLRGRIEAILDWARIRGYRDGENPARWRGHLENVFPVRSAVQTVKHFPALPYRDLPAFMAELAKRDGIGADALKFTILAAARTEQAIGTTWDEIDLENAVWTIPGERMKGLRSRQREHRVPLSKPALAILEVRKRLTGGQGFVFPGMRPKKSISNGTMTKVLLSMERGDITVHGFRSTFRDWVEEMTNYAGTVAEAALAHVVGDKVEAAYRRGDLFEKRRRLMAAWATYCTTPIASRVVSMHRAS